MILLIFSCFLNQSITWTTKTALPQVRSGPGCAVVNDTVYVIGGSTGTLQNTNYVYDPATDLWSTKAPMPTPRSHLGCAVVGGKIYAIGGFVGGVQTDTDVVEVYDPVTDSWSTKAPMPTSRYAFAIAVVANKIYVMGGILPVVATVEEYDPLFDFWTTKTSMPTRRFGPACGVIRDTIFVFGGSYNVGSRDTLVNECYYPLTNNWTTKAPMSFNRYASGGFSYNNEAYSVGGYNYSSYFTTIEVYDPVGNSWSTETPMNYARQSVAVGLVGNKVYVIGGWNSGALAYNEEGELTPMSVELTSFDAISYDFYIKLRWSLASSDEVYQCIVKRSTIKDGDYLEIARIPGSGSSPSPNSYSYKDGDVGVGIRYYYKLGVVKTNGDTQWYGPVSAFVTIAKPLLSISPNPIKDKAVISVQCSVPSVETEIAVSIYDLTGRLVTSFPLPTTHLSLTTAVSWDTKKLPPGVYFIKLKAGEFLISKKAIVLR